MPQLVKLHAELANTGFVVIANHVQNGKKSEVAPLVRSLKMKDFTVTSFSGVNVPNKPDGIPRAFLFDSNGKLVQVGRPTEMKQAIHDLVEKEPHFLAAGREYKELGRLAHALKRTRTYGPIIRRLEREAEKEGVAKEEAEYMLGRIRAHGQKLLEKAKELEKGDAIAALQAYKEIEAKWKGDEAGEAAAERLEELRDDEEFQKELKASQIAHRIRAQLENLKYERDGSLDLQSGPNRKITAFVTRYAQALEKSFPEAGATQTIKAELQELGFEI